MLLLGRCGRWDLSTSFHTRHVDQQCESAGGVVAQQVGVVASLLAPDAERAEQRAADGVADHGGGELAIRSGGQTPPHSLCKL